MERIRVALAACASLDKTGSYDLVNGARLGVSEKVKDRARQTFERSAEQAGFFAHGRNRLVQPGIVARVPEATAAPIDSQASVAPQETKKGNGGGFGDHDPLIVGLFRKLPEPEAEWSEEERLKWLETAANIFDLVFKGDCGGFIISPARADRSPRPREH